jgi:DNA polymerase III delta subunit
MWLATHSLALLQQALVLPASAAARYVLCGDDLAALQVVRTVVLADLSKHQLAVTHKFYFIDQPFDWPALLAVADNLDLFTPVAVIEIVILKKASIAVLTEFLQQLAEIQQQWSERRSIVLILQFAYSVEAKVWQKAPYQQLGLGQQAAVAIYAQKLTTPQLREYLLLFLQQRGYTAEAAVIVVLMEIYMEQPVALTQVLQQIQGGLAPGQLTLAMLQPWLAVAGDGRVRELLRLGLQQQEAALYQLWQQSSFTENDLLKLLYTLAYELRLLLQLTTIEQRSVTVARFVMLARNVAGVWREKAESLYLAWQRCHPVQLQQSLQSLLIVEQSFKLGRQAGKQLLLQVLTEYLRLAGVSW